jgi:signal transduction histidine kinase
MDFAPFVRMVRDLNHWIGAEAIVLVHRTAGEAAFRHQAVVSSDDEQPFSLAGDSIPTMEAAVLAGRIHGKVDGCEALLPLRTVTSDEVGLYLRFPRPVANDQRESLAVLESVLRPVLAQMLEMRGFRAEMAALMRILTHDLKNPANAVAGFVDILFGDFGSSLPEGVRDLLLRVRGSARRIHGILDGVYALRQATFNDPRPSRILLGDLVRESFRRVQEKWMDVPCQFTAPEELPTVNADVEKLDMALGALLDNSFKFRQKNLTLKIVLSYANLGEHRHSLEYRDNSLGFEPRFADVVFDPFRKLHPPADYPGAGVGLTVARKCLEQHGGEIRLQSAPGEGIRAFLQFSDLPPLES